MALSVLVVDDEALARSRLRTLLGDCTSPAVSLDGEAANATQALELLRRHSFDLVLLDIRMPGADGLTLAHCQWTDLLSYFRFFAEPCPWCCDRGSSTL